jgi:hydroxyacylglutathione hydrolase
LKPKRHAIQAKIHVTQKNRAKKEVVTPSAERTRLLFSIIPLRLGVINSFIIKGKKAVLVDTGYPGNADKILRHLERNHIYPGDLSLIILTHGHIDHYASAEELRAATGAPVAIYRVDAAYIGKGLNYLGNPTGLAGQVIKTLVGRRNEVRARVLIPDILIDGEIDLSAFGVQGRVIPTPGHTEGSISVILPEGKSIVGDLIMGGFVFRRLPRPPLFITDKEKWKQSLKRVSDLSHGTIFTSRGRSLLCLLNIVCKVLKQIMAYITVKNFLILLSADLTKTPSFKKTRINYP